jgi:uncharacterized protein (TIGR02271 family)
MHGRDQIRPGMIVRSQDGEKLGKVQSIGTDSFHIEKGLFFPKDYLVLFSEIQDIRDGEIVLSIPKSALKGTGSHAGAGTFGTHDKDRDRDRDTHLGTRGQRVEHEEVRVPVVEEQLDVIKREREVGAVRVRKDVVEDVKTVQVPVQKEVVRVEKVDTRNEPLPPGTAAFKKDEVVVPVREEDVEIRKRPAVTGEVRVQKERVVEERRASETVRKEDVRVEKEGDTRGVVDRDKKTRY